MWLDAADTRTITGNPVTTWADKSGNGRNATSPTGPSVSTYNGYPVLAFNGTSQYMISTSMTVSRNAHTLIAVHVPSNLTGNFQGNTSLFRFQQASGYLVFPYRQGTTSRGYITSADGSGAGSIDFANSTLLENSVTTQLNLIVANIASGNQRVFRNGTQQSSDTEALSAGTTDYLTIGAFGTGAEFYQGNLAEMIIFSRALTNSEQQQVEGYLAWKWGVASPPTTFPMSGLSLWLDGRDPNGNGTLPADNAALSTWVDKSGTGNSGTASGTTPLYQSSGGVLFSTGGYNTSYSASLANESMFFVYNPTSVPDTITLAGPNDVGGRAITVNTNRRLESSSYFVGFGSVSPNSTVTLNQNCQSGYVNTASSTVVVHNGTTYSPVSLSYTAGRTTRIGISGTNNAIPFKGIIREVLAYNVALTESQRQQVEGYLAWRWGIQSSLPSTHPFAPGSILPTSHPFRPNPTTMRIFQPIDISGCSLWLDAADRSRITFGTGSNISNWTDKSSNGYVFSQATSISQATYVENSLNGLPVVSLTTNRGLTGTTFSPNGLTAMSLFAVVNNTGNQNPTTNTNFQFLGWNETGGWGQVYLGAYTPFMEWRFGTGQAENKPFANFQSNVGASYNILSVSKSGTSEPAYRNGTLLSNYTAANTTISGTGSTTRLGLNSAQNNLAELIVYSGAITAEQRQQIEGYLAAKWGLSGSLPTTQPYYLLRALPSTPVFTPTSLSSISMWIDAADTTYTVGSTIGTVTDKSGNGYNLTGASGYTLQSNFNGSYRTFSSVLGSTNSLGSNTSFNLSGAFTTFAVGRNTNTFNSQPRGYLYDGANGTNRVAILDGGTMFTSAGGAYFTGSVNLTPFQSSFVATWVMNGASSFINTNGSLNSSGSLTNGTFGGIIVGNRFVLEQINQWNPSLSEMIIYNRQLTTNEIRQVEGYLAWKWGLQNNLPTTHPYRRFRP